MHVPKHFQENDTRVLHALIKSHPLGTWITSFDGELEVHHIPFVLLETSDGLGVLQGHVNIANEVWRKLEGAQSSLVVFQGAEAYISPSWYPSKAEHGKAVPTWNYAVVHASGHPTIKRDSQWLLNHLQALTNQQEARQTQPWSVNDAPDDYIQRMLRGIVGIEIAIDSLQGAWKTSQNKSAADKAGVIESLGKQPLESAEGMIDYIEKHTKR